MIQKNDAAFAQQLFRRGKTGKPLRGAELAAFEAMRIAAILCLLRVQELGSFAVPAPAVAVRRQEAGVWCFIPSPTRQVPRSRVQRGPRKQPVTVRFWIEQPTQKARQAWGQMCSRLAGHEKAIAEGQALSAEELTFTLYARLARGWFEQERRYGSQRPAIPRVLLVRREETRAPWVIVPTQDGLRQVAEGLQ